MARVSFSALIEEIIGKLAGSVFQDSYGGYQIRSRVSPRNPQSNYQQLRRGEFGFISASWRALTSIQRQTFIDAAITPPAALNLFIQANVNLSLIDEPLIASYVPSSAPAAMPIEITDLSVGSFKIKASGSTTIVPAGTTLLVFATYEKPPTKIFTNPSQFSPVIHYPAGTDLSSPTDISTEWISRFGIQRPNKQICIKSALIDTSNGFRTDTTMNCAISEEMPAYKVYTAYLTQAGTADPTVIILQNTLGGAVNWNRNAAGDFHAVGSGLYPTQSKVWCGISNNNPVFEYQQFSWQGGDLCILYAFNNVGVLSDNITLAQVEIRVYP